jgi:preprotein translocase subunit SecD
MTDIKGFALTIILAIIVLAVAYVVFKTIFKEPK